MHFLINKKLSEEFKSHTLFEIYYRHTRERRIVISINPFTKAILMSQNSIRSTLSMRHKLLLVNLENYIRSQRGGDEG